MTRNLQTASNRRENSGGVSRLVFSKSSVRRHVDRIVSVAVALASFFIFFGAGADFSFDYRHYIDYFDRLHGFGFQSVLKSLVFDFPSIYVYVPGSHLLFEPGFVLLSSVLLEATGSAPLAYALIASVSLAARVYILRLMGVPWLVVIALSCYTVTLFEANALRLGCAVTLLTFAVYCTIKKMPLAYIVISAVAAVAFHAQMLAFIIPFFAFNYSYTIYGDRVIPRLFAVSVLAGASLLLLPAMGMLDSGRLAEYYGREAGAGGVGVVSMLGLALVSFVLCAGFVRGRILSRYEHWRPLTIIALASVPSLTLFLFATDHGAVGGRVWQVAFVLLVAVSLSGSWFERNFQLRAVRVISLCLLLVSLVNVIYRFPLSNFFYPLTPYFVPY